LILKVPVFPGLFHCMHANEKKNQLLISIKKAPMEMDALLIF
jgi:hypothetical protein